MGHDTTAYSGQIQPADLQTVASQGELAEEIAYLRGNFGLYEVLDARFYDGRVGGIGIGRWFTRGQLQQGVRRLWARDRSLSHTRIAWRDGVSGRWRGSRYSVRPAIKFLQTCLDRMPADHDAVYIHFG